MNRLIFFSLIFSIMSCTEDVSTVSRTKQEQLDLDLTRIEGYLNENNLSGFSSTEEGLHYKLVEQGNSKYPANGDTISVEYIGELLNGSEFDRSNTNQPIEFVLGLGQVIEGWEMGIPKIDEAGSGILIIPSGLGYGPVANSSIPQNSVLIFRINLIEIR